MSVEVIELRPGQEFRVEINLNSECVLRLLEGTAELFGTELSPSCSYSLLGPRKAGIYTWHGCKLQVDVADKDSSGVAHYVADETPMEVYLNCHLALDARRKPEALDKQDEPRVMILGPADVGKSTLANLLGNWAMRSGHPPVMIDLDTTQPSFTLPGAITAVTLTQPLDIEESYCRSTFDVISYYYGFPQITDKTNLYKSSVENVARACREKRRLDKNLAKNGFIVNTPSQFCVSGVGYELLLHTIKLFEINCVIVIAHEKLCADLKKTFAAAPHDPQSTMPVLLKLPKSGGVVNKDAQYRRQVQDKRIYEYFYGSKKRPLHPSRVTLSFEDCHARRIGEAKAPSSALPLGADRKVDDSRFLKVDAGEIFLHSVFAVTHMQLLTKEGAEESDKESELIRNTNVAGFVYISSVDGTKKTLTVLTPTLSKLSDKYLLMGSLKWVEH